MSKPAQRWAPTYQVTPTPRFRRSPSSFRSLQANATLSGILFADFGFDLPGFGIVVHRDTLKAKSAAVKRFTSIIAGGWTYILNGHEQEGVDAIRAQRPQAQASAAVLKAQIEAYRPFFHTANTANTPIGLQSDADWAKTIKDLEEADTIPRGTKPSDYFTNDYVDYELFKKLTAV